MSGGEELRFIPDDWLYVRMDKSGNGPQRARHFFSATPDAKVEETESGYRVWSADCHPSL